MFKTISKFPEWRVLGILGIIVLGWHLLSIFGSFLASFADILLILVLSWILAFIIEPLVASLSQKGLSRTASAITVYLAMATLTSILIMIVLPTTITQLSQLSTVLPTYFPENSLWATRAQAFLASTLANSVAFASQVASTVTGLILVFIVSFYFVISRMEISKFLRDLIPDDYEDDYLFLENTINTTFASFLRVQVLLGLALGLMTFAVLGILKINFAISTSVAAGILAMIPVVGAIIFLVPPILAALTVSFDKLVIVFIVLLIGAQLVYNFWAPRLLGKALQIHPLVVLLSFLIGYKIAGVWGAVFSVPVTASLAIILKDLLKYWQEEADKS